MDSVKIIPGFTEDQRATAVELFWQAFREKLHAVMGPEAKARAFLTSVADPSHAISAVDESGTLLGIAGFKTADGAFIGGAVSDLITVYGLLGTVWRGPLLSMLERDLAANVLLMDGIFVADAARGQGIGTRLLQAIKEEARNRKLGQVRLDVIDKNTRARALYEREGFVAGAVQQLGPFRHIFGFSSATTMIFDQH
ncbi:MAG: GNAT family N-acetyltransferase [Pseudomonadota bacterium]